MNSQQRNERRTKAREIHVWSKQNPNAPLTDEHRAALKAHRLAEAADPNDGITVRDGHGNISVVSRSSARASEVAE
jgi:hypothetical protein